MINNFLIRDTNAFNDRIGGASLFALKKDPNRIYPKRVTRSEARALSVRDPRDTPQGKEKI